MNSTPKDRHIDLLTTILVNAVRRMQDATIKRGHPKINETVESLEIINVANNLQLDEGERNGLGGYNPNIAACVLPALKKSLLMTGKRIYDGPNERVITYDPKSGIISFEKASPEKTPLRDPNVVNIGGIISLSSVKQLGMMGCNIKEALGVLTESVLRDAAQEAIKENLRDTSLFAKRLEASRLSATPHTGKFLH